MQAVCFPVCKQLAVCTDHSRSLSSQHVARGHQLVPRRVRHHSAKLETLHWRKVFGRVLYSPRQDDAVTVSTLYTVRPLKQHVQLKRITGQFEWTETRFELCPSRPWCWEEHGRGSPWRRSRGWEFLCSTKDVIDPHVYYINNYFSFFSVKVCVKCIDKFRLVYFEFYAQCCSNGV